jgi:hypothetical protein
VAEVLQPDAAVTRRVRTPRPWYLDPLGDGLAILGAAGVITGVVFLVQADGYVDAANEPDDLDGWYQNRDAAHRARVIGTISLAAGGLSLAGGIVRWLLLPSGAPHVSVAPEERGASIILRGRF